MTVRGPAVDARRQLEMLDAVDVDDELGGEFDRHVERAGLGPLRATGIDVLQINVGKLCNQACHHCHVDAGPLRTEQMSQATAEACMRALAGSTIPTVDITGGAPELNPSFRYLVEESTRLGRRVMDRCNLTILEVDRYRDLPEFLAEHRVELVCSLPHYRRLNTDRQRGDGVFEASIRVLRRLNELGYGRDGERTLTLVANPVGAFLPAGQASLEAEWKREMQRLHGVVFDRLIEIANMPISRYLQWLEGSGNLADYLRTLVSGFNPAAAGAVMCRSTLSVGWDGRLYDCDFNQMLDLELREGLPTHIADFDARRLAERAIVTRRHCFGCTAGAGSSCGGALTEVGA